MVIRKMAVQTLVMISPTGKMPSCRPGMTNPGSAIAPALELGLDEAASANAPLTKDVPSAERFVFKGIPSPLVAERVMVGARSERMTSLFHS